jgi:ATP-dependent Clp protease adaptor protein ClpS
MTTPKKGSPKQQGDVAVVTDTRTRTKLKRPKLFRVLLHNDDFTTMEFVVAVLISIFHKSETDATAIMLNIHRTGMGVAGVYSYEIAEAKVNETMQAAEEAEYPLLCTLEPDDDPDNDGDGPDRDGHGDREQS